jgi:hypothetical protein
MEHYWHKEERSLQQRYEKNGSWCDAAASAQTAVRLVDFLRIPEGFWNRRQPWRGSVNDHRFARGYKTHPKKKIGSHIKKTCASGTKQYFVNRIHVEWGIAVCWGEPLPSGCHLFPVLKQVFVGREFKGDSQVDTLDTTGDNTGHGLMSPGGRKARRKIW